jgi:hypothetical protein
VSDEWRLTAVLDGGPEEIAALAANVTGRLPAAARLTRDGRTLRVYSEGETEAARIEQLVLGLLDKGGLGYELWHDRWDEEAGEWEEIAPDLPPGEEPAASREEEEEEEAPSEPEEPAAQPARAPSGFPGAVGSLRDAGALVLVTFADRESGPALRARLTEAGIPAVSRRRGVGIPALDEAAAAELAASLGEQLPPGTRIETTRVPGRRRR